MLAEVDLALLEAMVWRVVGTANADEVETTAAWAEVAKTDGAGVEEEVADETTELEAAAVEDTATADEDPEETAPDPPTVKSTHDS